MADDRDGYDQLGEDTRISGLDERLRKAQATEATRTGADKPGPDANQRLGNRVLADLIGGLAGGALFGWLFDRLFDTTPWGLIGFLFLGIVVAFRNIFKLASERPKQ